MKRTLAILALIAGLAFTASPALAAGQGDCSDTSGNYFEANQQFAISPGTTVDAIRAQIDTTGWYACTNPDSNDIYGISGWIALSPATFYNAFSLVQVGAVACDTGDDPPSSAYDPCYYHPNQVRWFLAYGGCILNGQLTAPTPIDLTDWQGLPTPSGNSHEWKLTRESDRFKVYFDGTNYFDLLDSSYDPVIGCWSHSAKRGNVDNEAWNPGDSWGLSPNNSHMGSVQFSDNRDGLWHNTTWNASSNCNAASDNPPPPPSVSQHCDVLSVNSYRAYNTIP